MEIKILRLISGEELLARVNEFSDGYSIEKPVLLVPSERGLQTMQFMPHTKAYNEETRISKQHVLFAVNPVDEIVNKYREQTSGLITGPSSLLKG